MTYLINKCNYSNKIQRTPNMLSSLFIILNSMLILSESSLSENGMDFH